MGLAINRQEITNVATRNKYATIQDYVESVLSDAALTPKLEASAQRMQLAFETFAAVGTSNSSSKVFLPNKLSSTLIRIENKAGDYVQFDGASFKFSSAKDLATKFSDFGMSLASLAADTATSLKSVTFGTKSGVVAKLDVTSTEIKLTVGKEVVSIKGDFPTKLGQIYSVIKETTGLDSSTGFDISKLKLLALKAGSALSKFDVDSITLTSNKVELVKATFADKLVKVTSGALSIEAKGHFPDNAGELYTAMREMVAVNKSGVPSMFTLVKTIGANASLHDYDVDSISVKNGSKVVASATFTTKTATLQIGDLKLIATGAFPHSAADFAQLMIDLQAGTANTTVKLTSLKLIDMHDNSVLASVSGTISAADALNVLNTVSGAIAGTLMAVGTNGADTIVGNAAGETLLGFGGGDDIRGGSGKDYIDGGSGVDKLYGDSGNDHIRGGSSGDKLYGGTGQDTLYGDSGNDMLYGGADNDVLYGGTGNDTLVGDSGNDKLTGGAGADMLYGGPGSDRFIYLATADSTVGASGRDTIFDFTRSSDKIDLSAIDANTKIGGDQGFAFIASSAFSKVAGQLRYEKSGGDTFISGDINGDGKADFTIMLDASVTLSSSDFLL